MSTTGITVARVGEDEESIYTVTMDHFDYCRIQMMLTLVHNIATTLRDDEKVWLREVGKILDEARRPSWMDEFNT